MRVRLAFGHLLGLKDSRMRRQMTETCQWPQASSPTGSRVQAGRDDLDPPPEVGRRPGGVPALQKKKININLDLHLQELSLEEI